MTSPKRRSLLKIVSPIILLVGVTVAAPAWAQAGGDAGADGFLPDYPDPIETRARSQGPGFFDVALKLAFVLALIYAAAWAWKRYGKVGGGSGGDEVMRIWATKGLGLGSEMILVEIGDRMLLVGRAGSSISTLTEFDDPDVINELKATCVVPIAVPAGNWLDRLSRREGGR